MDSTPADELQVFWGEMHDNTYQFAQMPAPFEEVVRRARSHLDFYAAAYYTAFSEAFEPGGHLAESDQPHRIILEGWKPQERLDREWAEVQEVTRALDEPGRFVTFPGYEWQGDGSSGDHNVFARREGLPIFRADTLAELYERLRGRDALAIPHHTAYRVGVRGHDWSVHDETLSPFAEILSVHGCSETDEEWVGLRQNPHMGPGVAGGTWQDALDRGHRIGCIASTDNWGEMPGHYGRGRAAVLAPELSRDALWDALKARRVYAVTGDKIEVDFRVNGAVMGQAIAADGPRQIAVRVRGSDAIDRIELLRDGRVVATHCHQGTWDLPTEGHRTRFKLRVEVGWGPRPNELPARGRQWEGRLAVEGGRVVGWEPCWISPGQEEPRTAGGAATFRLRSSTRDVGLRHQNANVFEIEADPAAPLRLELNGLAAEGRVSDFARGSRELWYRDECVQMLAEEAGIPPESPERQDIYHHVAYKAKLHRAIPEAGFTAELRWQDHEPLTEQTHYRVRVAQRNGQRAWTSPVWVRPPVGRRQGCG